MKSLIRKILKEETQQRSLKDVIFDDLVSTFNEEVLIYDWGDEYSNMIKAIKNIINNAAIPHIENVYNLEYFENEDFIKPILDKFVRYLYNDDYPLVGDTIEMIEMDGEDPNPILPGTKGVVTRIESQVISGIPEEHLWINWENGRTLKVLLPHDKIKIIKRGESSRGVIGRLELMEDKIDDFVDFVSGDLELEDNFTVDITNDSDDVETLASYDINNNEVTVLGKNRSLPDIIRSVAHELVHHKQNERGELTGRQEEGEDGSPWEDEANAKAGELVRKYGRENPEIYET
tara:strand:- start:18491 stop:19360 length:870 start_codon:yes stop_codon:yes gene_type:complete